MGLSKNLSRGYLGITTTAGGVVGIAEAIPTTPTVISTSQADNANNITLPSNIIEEQTILILAASRLTIPTLSGYNLISSHTSSDPRTSIFYKIANGTEGGTSLTVLSDNGVIGCIVLDRGTPDVIGSLVRSDTSSVTATSILPTLNGSLIFLCSFCDQTSNDPTNDGGFTNVVIDGANNAGGTAKELFVWSKISDGSATGDVTVNWGASRTTAGMFSVI